MKTILAAFAMNWFATFGGTQAFAQAAAPPPPHVPLVGSGIINLDSVTGRAQIKLPESVPASVCRSLRKTNPDWLDPTQQMILSKCEAE